MFGFDLTYCWGDCNGACMKNPGILFLFSFIWFDICKGNSIKPILLKFWLCCLWAPYGLLTCIGTIIACIPLFIGINWKLPGILFSPIEVCPITLCWSIYGVNWEPIGIIIGAGIGPFGTPKYNRIKNTLFLFFHGFRHVHGWIFRLFVPTVYIVKYLWV